MRMDTFDKAMTDAGVTSADIYTKAYERVKKAIQDNPEIIIGESLGDALKEAATISEALKKQTSGARLEYISNRDLVDAVACFANTLKVTQGIFGPEAMTESVICKAIEAGSYIAYRAIMGEASTPGKRY